MIKREVEKTQHERALDIIQSVYEGFKEDPSLWHHGTYFKVNYPCNNHFDAAIGCCTVGGFKQVSGNPNHSIVDICKEITRAFADNGRITRHNDQGYDSTINMLETTLKKEGRL